MAAGGVRSMLAKVLKDPANGVVECIDALLKTALPLSGQLLEVAQSLNFQG